MDGLPNDCEILAWPILDQKKDINNKINNYKFVYASKRAKDLWDKYYNHKTSVVWPVWIDTYSYTPSKQKKNNVLIYFKTRYPEELKYCESLLKKLNIEYNIINYDTWYKEIDFLNLLDKSKYVIRIGRQETQWIALEECLSKNIPILLRDVRKVGDRSPNTEYEKGIFSEDELQEFATAAPYFDDSCWIRFYNKEELENNIINMEKNYKKFTPRKYIKNNLSLEKQAKEIISFYSNPSRWNEIKKKKYIKNNVLLKIEWTIIDSRFFSIFYKEFVKFYKKYLRK